MGETKATTPDSIGSESSKVCNESSQEIQKSEEPSGYPIRPGEKDCLFYLRTGLCGYGSTCRFNHPRPTEISEEIIDQLCCKFYMVGACKKGSRCQFYHPKNKEVAKPVLFNVPGLPTHQGRIPYMKANDSGKRFDERTHWRYKTESRFGTNKRNPIFDAQENHQEPEQRNTKRQRIEGQENVSEHIQRQMIEGQENVYEQIRRPMIEGQENLHKQKQRDDIERHAKKAPEDLQQECLQNISKIQNVDAQQNLGEERKKKIEKERREARLKLDQIKQTVIIDEWHRTAELVNEIGSKQLLQVLEFIDHK